MDSAIVQCLLQVPNLYLLLTEVCGTPTNLPGFLHHCLSTLSPSRRQGPESSMFIITTTLTVWMNPLRTGTWRTSTWRTSTRRTSTLRTSTRRTSTLRTTSSPPPTMRNLVTQVMMTAVLNSKLVMNHITPLLLRLTVDMVVAWKQGLSSQYTKFCQVKRGEEQRSYK